MIQESSFLSLFCLLPFFYYFGSLVLIKSLNRNSSYDFNQNTLLLSEIENSGARKIEVVQQRAARLTLREILQHILILHDLCWRSSEQRKADACVALLYEIDSNPAVSATNVMQILATGHRQSHFVISHQAPVSSTDTLLNGAACHSPCNQQHCPSHNWFIQSDSSIYHDPVNWFYFVDFWH